MARVSSRTSAVRILGGKSHLVAWGYGPNCNSSSFDLH